jgi:hypothetical protein
MTMHKHDALIRAWLDGKTVQYTAYDGAWTDLTGPDAVESLPRFYAASTYRLKPVAVRYRVWVDKLGAPHIASTLMQSDTVEKLPTFGRWLHEWTEAVL